MRKLYIVLKWSGLELLLLNATFNNITFISWRLILLVEETGVPGEKHRPAASHWQTLSHSVVSSTPRLSRNRTHNVSGGRNCDICTYNMSVLSMLFAILNLYGSSKAICIHRYSRTGQPHPLFSKLQKQNCHFYTQMTTVIWWRYFIVAYMTIIYQVLLSWA
jgi:hypothetical protein